MIHSNILHSASTVIFYMATTSSELDVINSNPIKKDLGTFQRLFELTRADLGVSDSSNAVQVVLSTAAVVAKNLLLDLILSAKRTGSILPSRITGRTLSSDLTILYSPTTRASTTSSEAEFWSSVFDLLVSWIKTTTPPTAFEKAVFDTPLRSSSASQRGIEQTHDEVDLRIGPSTERKMIRTGMVNSIDLS
ncbi:hypothetical protein BJ875DRAFT_491694 [Amylocarpus encephaloides]|uniref:Uncharacterized protein n=1 Tax=Amylocarpus encephaloides TaxID=45428 RepID=A0A9P7YT30_9HELO|nr:hypothetical protein BJ875DRAFT_491694 [Amylocarpus encephaloides]